MKCALNEPLLPWQPAKWRISPRKSSENYAALASGSAARFMQRNGWQRASHRKPVIDVVELPHFQSTIFGVPSAKGTKQEIPQASSEALCEKRREVAKRRQAEYPNNFRDSQREHRAV